MTKNVQGGTRGDNGLKLQFQAMLSGTERAQVLTWRARASAELQSIEDGLLGRDWRERPAARARVALLAGFIRGASDRLNADAAKRN